MRDTARMAAVQVAGCLLLLTTASRAVAQTSGPPPWADSMVVITPGAQYAKGGLFRALAGSHYRDLWVTPIRVPVLSLQRFAQGLRPLKAHVGSQTKSLRFAGGDGREYQFRSVDKDPTAMLAPEVQGSTAAKLQRDGVSASLPAAALVASGFLEATDILHVSQTLAVMPDDPALGEFRDDFKGMLGMIEERPDDRGHDGPSFAGARRVISPTRLFELLDASPDNRVDARVFLAARLMDIYMGDRDRHRDQFRWASFGKDRPVLWEPISRDHDEAFVNLDGPALGFVRNYYPQLVAFGANYPKQYQLNWHAREIDRRFLVELERPTWDSVATALQSTLTDSVIHEAVDDMPPEMVAVGGERLDSLLRLRRDKLVSEALDYYAFLSAEVEIRATDAAEVATVARLDSNHVAITLRAQAQAQPYFDRSFDDRETHEIRLKLWGGDDSVLVRGEAGSRIRLRIVGGAGDDVFIDSLPGGTVKFYDDSGATALESTQHRSVNTKRFQEWVGSDLNRYPPREWGTWWRPIPWLGASADLGLFLGVGVLRTEYGFRRVPYASDIRARIGYATGAQAIRADRDAKFHPENTTWYWRVQALASGIEVLRYYGLGNDTEESGGSDFHRVRQQQYSLDPALVMPIGRATELSAGISARYSHTGANEGRFIAGLQDTLLGAGDFGQVGGRIGVVVDTRDNLVSPRRGVLIAATGQVYPAVWDVPEAYGSVDGEAATFVSAPLPANPTLALRIGGRKLWGEFPFQESAFIGGRSSVRGYCGSVSR